MEKKELSSLITERMVGTTNPIVAGRGGWRGGSRCWAMLLQGRRARDGARERVRDGTRDKAGDKGAFVG